MEHTFASYFLRKTWNFEGLPETNSTVILIPRRNLHKVYKISAKYRRRVRKCHPTGELVLIDFQRNT